MSTTDQTNNRVQGLLKTVTRITEKLGELGFTGHTSTSSSSLGSRGNLSSIFLSKGNIFDTPPDTTIVATSPTADVIALNTQQNIATANRPLGLNGQTEIVEERRESVVAPKDPTQKETPLAYSSVEDLARSSKTRNSTTERPPPSSILKDSTEKLEERRKSVVISKDLGPHEPSPVVVETPARASISRRSIIDRPQPLPPSKEEPQPLPSSCAPFTPQPRSLFDITTQTSQLSLKPVENVESAPPPSKPEPSDAYSLTNLKVLLSRQDLEMQSLLDQNEALKRENKILLKRASLIHPPSQHNDKTPKPSLASQIHIQETLTNYTSTLETLSKTEQNIYALLSDTGTDFIRSGIQIALLFESVRKTISSVKAVQRSSITADIPNDLMDVFDMVQDVLGHISTIFGCFNGVHFKQELQRKELVELKRQLHDAFLEIDQLDRNLVPSHLPQPQQTAYHTTGIQTTQSNTRSTGIQVHSGPSIEEEVLANDKEILIRRLMDEKSELLKHYESLDRTIQDWKHENASLRRILEKKEELGDDKELNRLKDKIAALKDQLAEERLRLKKANFLLKRVEMAGHGVEKVRDVGMQSVKNSLVQSTVEFREVVCVLAENKDLKVKLENIHRDLQNTKNELDSAQRDNESLQNSILKLTETIHNNAIQKDHTEKELSSKIHQLEKSHKEVLDILAKYDVQYNQVMFLYNDVLGLPICSGTTSPYDFEKFFTSLLKLYKEAKENLVTLQAKASELTATKEKISSSLLVSETTLSETKASVKELEKELSRIREMEGHTKEALRTEVEKRRELEEKLEKLIRGCIAYAAGEPIPQVSSKSSGGLSALLRGRDKTAAF